YAPSAWTELQEVLLRVKFVYDDGSATQTEIDAAEEMLRNALREMSAGTTIDKPNILEGLSGNQMISLKWNVSFQASVAPIQDYQIEYSLDGGKTWTRYVLAPDTSTSRNLTGLINNQPYWVRVAGI